MSWLRSTAHPAKERPRMLRLTISNQRCTFSMEAFIATTGEWEDDKYKFALRECMTGQTFDDVHDFRSKIGILFTIGFKLTYAVDAQSTNPSARIVDLRDRPRPSP